ncbi:hypothetical protein M409DRAFT_66619 [Zasmidium cellare ATCC 36951]|uniref:Svf1-like C-terminal domain-containing protein n=1 Tax=Zasmidium cellare ATCC 36951 TaxID=1080233 RepID=A0A6A6CHL5_ZASCE|nr:uncharacterized protein M409DRAFT_66619 [Zasmidium cellare ATCC 36951]KAF2166625.1 hypothetical protein M409DRAFT_66619 [Zasmidium cellare ATCC 36951]
MFDWAKQKLGVSDPTYRSSAILSVAEQASETPFSELKRENQAWECIEATSVESKTFYMVSNSGKFAWVQVIYSNIMNLRRTVHFNTKIYPQDPSGDLIWSLVNVLNFSFSPDKQDFAADDCSLSLDESGESFQINSRVDPGIIVDLTFTKTAPGIVAGKNGTTNFGPDPETPWGRIKHAFWPRCRVEGTIMTRQGLMDFDGQGMVSHALQGMQPHLAAARWNFGFFQGPTYSAFMMEFITPPSYGNTIVNVGAIATDGTIVLAGASPLTRVQHVETRVDPETDYPEPCVVDLTWEGTGTGGRNMKAKITSSLGARTDRIDVMGEMPRVVKQLLATASGAKPYIYQYIRKVKLMITFDDQVFREEEGQLFMETTFLS